MQTLQQLRSVVSQVFEYFIAHCTHKLVLVRTTALRFSGRMLDRFPWLLSDYSGERERGRLCYAGREKVGRGGEGEILSCCERGRREGGRVRVREAGG
jgi:hypothetical protein